MKSYEVVLDTNCIISALVFNGITGARFRRLWQTRVIIPIMCPETMSELKTVLAYGKFGLNRQMQKMLLDNILPHVKHFPSIEPIEEVKELLDPKDAVFIRLAQKSQADFLVSGDKHIYMLREIFPSLHIHNPAQFIRIIDG